MDTSFREMLVEKYNRERENDTRCFYSDNENIVEKKKNGYIIVRHYDNIEKASTGFFNEFELDEAVDYLRCIYDIDEDDEKSLNSYIRLWSKGKNNVDSKWDSIKLEDVFNKTDKFKSILNNMCNCNMFISPNTFCCKSHKMNSLMGINAFTIDLDYKKTLQYRDCTPEKIISILEEKYFYSGVSELDNKEIRMPCHMIPRPNFIEYGNQIRLIYLVDKIKLSKKGRRRIIRFVKSIKKKIEKRLEEFGADASPNLNSFIRVPYSINKKIHYELRYIIKSQTTDCYLKPISEDRYIVYIKEYSRRRYYIQDIADHFILRKNIKKYIDIIKESKKKGIILKKKRHGGVDFTEYNLLRIRDIEKLQLLKNKGKVAIHRENLCFAYMVHLKLQKFSEKSINDRMEQFINNFSDNTDGKKLLLKCKNVLKNNYKFTTAGIREYFDLDIDFCRKHGLKSFVGVEYTKEERKMYSREYYLKFLKGERKYNHLNNNQKGSILKMNSEGLKVEEIANRIGCTIQTVYRNIKEEVKSAKRIIEKSIEDAIEYIKEGKTIKQIAEILNINYETLRKRVYRYKQQYSI